MPSAKHGCVLLLAAAFPALARAQDTVEFNRDIRPILSNNCFVCHGPDNNLRKAKMRLDQLEDAAGVRGAKHVLTAGKPEESELLLRLLTHEPDKRMPPPKLNRAIPKDQIDTIRRWIAQGAKYQNHWSLIPAQKPALPQVKDGDWARNSIDRFILARLEKEGLKPSPAADHRTLVRRLYFDLLGLPPTSQDVEAFEKSAIRNPQSAIDDLVDRLLDSPHFGERLAQHWLDVARYADSAGYHSDNERAVSLYRDWVIDAFNKNLPFDRFLTWQLAGDLLPNATNDQKIASGYNRLLQTTEEGGAQAKEYQAKYYADRVRNTAGGILGLTLGCAECHDHKFDPLLTREFYQFAAFFADIQETSVGRQAQTPIMTAAQIERLKKLEADLAPLQKTLDTQIPALDTALADWEQDVKKQGLKGVPKEVLPILNVDPAQRTPAQQQALAKHFRTVSPLLAEPRQQAAALQKEKADLQKAAPTTLISMSGPPRTIRILPRGNWLDEKGDIVLPGTPAALGKFNHQGQRATRIDLAKWITSPDNPLTARVFVNRLWSLYFGHGIVKTMDDFGNQGTWPTHPELLDWLAVAFMKGTSEPEALATGPWDIKRLIKTLVTSNTYRQSSLAPEALRQRDPYNQLYARQSRHRLDAEMIRDNALAVSGLLVKKVGGPSVKPYQPAKYWAYLNFPTREWANDKGEALYRRGLYTFWQRTFLHPSLLAFDAPSREECTVERPRSNTPQQALVLLNDPTYVEAARVFAERILKEGPKDQPARIDFAFRQALQRSPRPEEAKVLANLIDQHRQHYQETPKAAEMLLRVGDHPAARDLAPAELAAWTSAARVILNLHETITRN